MDFIFNINYVWLALYQLFAFFVQGLTGFGSTVLAAPFHTSVLGPASGTAYATLLCTPTLIFLGIKEIKNVSWKDLLKIVIVCTPGLLVGQFLLQQVDPAVAKLAIGIIVTLIASMNIYKTIIAPLVLKKEFEENPPITTKSKILGYIALAFGGIVHGAFTSGGPFITIYTLQAVKDKVKFRNTMTWVWVVLNLMNSVKHFTAGYYTDEMWSALALGLPFAFIGLFIGMKMLDKVNKITFLRAVYIMLLIIGINSIYSNLGSFL